MQKRSPDTSAGLLRWLMAAQTGLLPTQPITAQINLGLSLWLDEKRGSRHSEFLAGYGAAQAVPGPLFTFAAFLGAGMEPSPNGIAGAAICLVAIFAPGLLLVTGVLPFWDLVRVRPLAQAAMRGANAAVVGILAAALYSPVATGAILSPADFAVALVGFVLLTAWKCPPWIVVVLTGACGVGFALI